MRVTTVLRRYFLIILLAVAGFLFWGFFAPLNAPKTFIIQEGENGAQISVHLKRQNVIHSSTLFRFLVWFSGAHHKLRAGEYSIEKPLSLIALVQYLDSDTAHPLEKIIRITEGWSNNDIAAYLSTKGYGNTNVIIKELTQPTSYERSLLDALGVPANATIEGFCFPDTYRVYQRSNINDIIAKCLGTFNRRVTNDLRTLFAHSGLSLYQAVTLASIIEKEVPGSEDRKKIADLFLRRLALGMPLQADSTLNYITNGRNVSATAQQLQSDSPYNTYRNKGLPPGPIGNPSLDALSAVAQPTTNQYLYFLTVGDPINDPEHVNVYYSTSFDEHVKKRLHYLGR